MLPTNLLSSTIFSTPTITMAERPQALVYRGRATSDQCPEAVTRLLETAKNHFNVTYCGPDEAFDIFPDVLAQAAVYAYPGGPGRTVHSLQLKSE
jgi:hypothetical protein